MTIVTGDTDYFTTLPAESERPTTRRTEPNATERVASSPSTTSSGNNHENGYEERQQRRPAARKGDALRPTGAFFPRGTRTAAAAQMRAPRDRRSPHQKRAGRPDGDVERPPVSTAAAGPRTANGRTTVTTATTQTARANKKQTAITTNDKGVTAKKKRGWDGRSGWELSELIRPLAGRRRRTTPVKRRTILPYYARLVLWVYRVRFATTAQIRQAFERELGSERTAQRRLAHLAELNYLATAPVRSTSPNFPNVYFATEKGLRWIRELADERGASFEVSPAEERKQRGRALDSVLHELLLTEFQLALDRSVRHRDDLRLLMSERRYFRAANRLRFTYEGRTKSVIPDAGFVLAGAPVGKITDGASQNACFAPLFHAVEMDNGTMSLPRLLTKLRNYERWGRSDEGREYLTQLLQEVGSDSRESTAGKSGRLTRPNFRLLIICHDKSGVHAGGDERRLLDVWTQSVALSARMRERIWLTTVERLRAHQALPHPLDSPLWLRVRDARPLLFEYRSLLESLPTGRGHKPYRHQRELWAERLGAFPYHALLPNSETQSLSMQQHAGQNHSA